LSRTRLLGSGLTRLAVLFLDSDSDLGSISAPLAPSALVLVSGSPVLGRLGDRSCRTNGSIGHGSSRTKSRDWFASSFSMISPQESYSSRDDYCEFSGAGAGFNVLTFGPSISRADCFFIDSDDSNSPSLSILLSILYVI